MTDLAVDGRFSGAWRHKPVSRSRRRDDRQVGQLLPPSRELSTQAYLTQRDEGELPTLLRPGEPPLTAYDKALPSGMVIVARDGTRSISDKLVLPFRIIGSRNPEPLLFFPIFLLLFPPFIFPLETGEGGTGVGTTTPARGSRRAHRSLASNHPSRVSGPAEEAPGGAF